MVTEGGLLKRLEEIAGELASSDEELRRLAVVSLAGRPQTETGELLFRALGDQSWRVRKEAVSVILSSPTPPPEIVDGLIALIRCHDNAGKRNAAVETLIGLGTVVVEPLCRHLDDFDHDLRKFVIDILGSIGSADCVPLLLAAMDDPDPNVRCGAVENLGKIGDPRAIPQLLQALKEGDLWFRFAILDALAAIGAPVPLERIVPLMSETLLRRAIYDCLGAIGDLKALPVLLEGIQEKARSAREAAAVALMRLRSRLDEKGRPQLDAALKELKGAHRFDGVLRSLASAEPAVLEQLVALVTLVADPRAALPLLIISRHERLRSRCVHAFKAIGPEVLPELWGEFPTGTAADRAFIAFLCGELGDREAGGTLIAALKDDSDELRIAALLSLGKLAIPGAPAEIAKLLADREPAVAAAALESLERLSTADPAAIAAIAAELAAAPAAAKRRKATRLLAGLRDADRLALLAKDEDATVRQGAVSALARLRDPHTVKHLMMALVDEVPEVRVAAAAALGEAGGEEALEPLLLALSDEEDAVRIASLKGLALLRDRRALPGVADHVAGSRGAVLIAGLKTLAALGGADSLGPVRQALADEDEEVVEAAIEILSRFGGEWIRDCSDRLMHHPHWGVRSSFVRALGETLGSEALPFLKEAAQDEADPLVKGEIEGLMDRLG